MQHGSTCVICLCVQVVQDAPANQSSGKSTNTLVGIHETTKVRQQLAKQEEAGELSWGNAMFIEFGHRYLRPYVVKDQPLEQIISDCVYCILFVGFWRRDIMIRNGTLREGNIHGRLVETAGPARPKNSKKSSAAAEARKLAAAKKAADAAALKEALNMRENFMTMEVMNDVLISCEMMILNIIMFGKHFKKVKFEAGRFSSRWSEYTFQQLRAATKTSNKLCAYQYTHIARAIMAGLEVASGKGTEMIQPMQSKRGHENTTFRCDKRQWGDQPDGYYPTEIQVHAACKHVSWHCEFVLVSFVWCAYF